MSRASDILEKLSVDQVEEWNDSLDSLKRSLQSVIDTSDYLLFIADNFLEGSDRVFMKNEIERELIPAIKELMFDSNKRGSLAKLRKYLESRVF